MDELPLPAIDELVALIEERTADQPPATRLRIAIDLGRDLSELGDTLIGRFVGQAREAGLSWTEIGQAFGTPPAESGAWSGRWSPTARRVLDQAVVEARALGHDYVGTEHALLAVVSLEHGVAAEVLAELGVTRERMLRTSCMQAGGDTRTPPGRLTMMPRYKQALEHGLRIADALEAREADSEHLLAGIVAVPDSMAVEILRRLRVRPDAVRSALAERLEVDRRQLGAPRRRRRLLAGSR
jgi:ClpA/ClpB-like protein